MRLQQLDLNLLLLFDALYRHGSVNLAAEELCLSQSAFSHGLARLRQRLDDDLFVRTGKHMQPTPRAIKLAAGLHQALPLLDAALSDNSSFEPLHSKQEFTLAATDYTEFHLLPSLTCQLATLAPGIRLKLLPASRVGAERQLEDSNIDFVLGFTHDDKKYPGVESLSWYQGSYCTLAKAGHPALKKGLDMQTFLSLSHIRISPWGERSGIVDKELHKRGLSRHVAVQLPSALAAAFLAVQSDYLLTLPRHIADTVLKHLDIELFAPPLPIPDYRLKLYWHKVNKDKPAHRWLREQIATISKAAE
ncbi:LysR family transcriptional regulator [Bowmanella pacifica]|uniref:Transcriptional regulator n=1 Tax=Bowmanella pacifica TaxID=502051 RepID=A0A917YSS9_9ALTE|nr:LysR family transcriptional regulator [Bowmanella pacifica]GGO64598.1 transcriptional regulator [Bowmanella pacifica]